MNGRFISIMILCLLLTKPSIIFTKEHAKHSKKNQEVTKAHLHKKSHAGEGEIDYSNPKNQRRMGIFHYNEGNKFLNNGDWQEAERNYKMALHHDKTLYQVYINLSTAYLQGGAYSEALKTLEQLRSMQPENPMLHYNLACYYSLTGDNRSALESLKKATILGFKNKRQIESDSDLKNLRKNKEFLKWIEKF